MAARDEQRHSPPRVALNKCRELAHDRREGSENGALGCDHQIPIILDDVPGGIAFEREPIIQESGDVGRADIGHFRQGEYVRVNGLQNALHRLLGEKLIHPIVDVPEGDPVERSRRSGDAHRNEGIRRIEQRVLKAGLRESNLISVVVPLDAHPISNHLC